MYCDKCPEVLTGKGCINSIGFDTDTYFETVYYI